MMKLTSTQGFGLLLVGITLVSCTGWVVQSYQAHELVGSPFFWAVILIGFFVGLRMAAGVTNNNTPLPGLRKKLILYYLAIGGGMAVAFLLIHIVMGKRPLVAAQTYTPFVLLAVLISYIPFYLLWGCRSGVAKRSSVLMPVMYLTGIALAPIAAIDLYNQAIDQVEWVESPRQLSEAKSNFIQFRKMDIRPDKTIYDEYHKDVDKGSNHRVTYQALIPVNTERQDTLFEVWIPVEFYEIFNNNMDEDSLIAREQIFFAMSRDRIQLFSTDSVVFYDKGKQRGYERLNEVNYPLAQQSIILNPVYKSLKEYQTGEILAYLILLGLSTLIFWAVTTVSD